MNNKKDIIFLILVLVFWLILNVVEHYLTYALVTLLWLVLSFTLFIIAIIQLVKLFRERKNISKMRIVKVIFWVLLFYFTLYRWHFDKIIEKADWHIFYNKRMEIVKKVQQKEIFQNDDYGLYKLPFDFPIVSHDGNDIMIIRNDSTNTITIEFFIFRNFFSAPSTYLIYTNDEKNINDYDNFVKREPKHNWKIKDNWYRIMVNH